MENINKKNIFVKKGLFHHNIDDISECQYCHGINHYVTLRDKFIYLLHENNKSQHFHNPSNFHPSCKFDIT